MSNPYNGSKSGKRGNNPNRPSRKDLEIRSKGTTNTARLLDSAVYQDGYPTESTQDYLIPRRSLTFKQGLSMFPQKVETESRLTRQLDHKDCKNDAVCKIIRNVKRDNGLTYGVNRYGKACREACTAKDFITTTDERVVWKSDKSLLKHTPKQESLPRLSRMTSRSKVKLPYTEEHADLIPGQIVKTSDVTSAVVPDEAATDEIAELKDLDLLD